MPDITSTVTNAISQATDNGSNNNAVQNTTENTTNTDKINVAAGEESLGVRKGQDVNFTKDKGILYPILRINDHYLYVDEIVEFSVETGYYKNYMDYFSQKKGPITGFVPTMKLVIKTSAPDLLKQNQIKSGDICAVFFRNNSPMVKSYRGDYVITSCVCSDIQSEIVNTTTTYILEGKLNVPNLTNDSVRFNYMGSSRDAMYDCAQRLGLGFYFSDPDNTDDYQNWMCSSNLLDYAIDVTSHAWKEFNAFYDAWIDPRYGLSFININKMLIEDGLDEPIDLTPFDSTVQRGLGMDGANIKEDEATEKQKTKPQAKLLHNIINENDSLTSYYIDKWKVLNRAAEITYAIGINKQDNMNIDNPGVQTEDTNIPMDYSIPINQTKLQNGFFVLMGPGVNLTYTQADQVNPEQSFVRTQNTITGGSISEMMSTGDADQMMATGTNMYASGNTSKFYDVAWEHNMRNNLQLQKQYLEVDLTGCNLSIMRGEKIPVLIVDYNKMTSTVRNGDKDNNLLRSTLYESACGWYIIDGIMWEWKHNRQDEKTTPWRTKVKLVRREWPIPGSAGFIKDDSIINAETKIDVNSNSSEPNSNSASATAPEAANTDAKSALEVAEPDKAATDNEMPLTGLTTGLKRVYQAIKSVIPGILLVSARRWAVNEEDKRIEADEPSKGSNGMYKYSNAKGEIRYYAEKGSRHAFGQAIDIINNVGTSFDQISSIITKNNYILQVMSEEGCTMFIEQSTDDTGNKVQHYHIGTDNGEKLTHFWNVVKNVNKNLSLIVKTNIDNIIAINNRARS